MKSELYFVGRVFDCVDSLELFFFLAFCPPGPTSEGSQLMGWKDGMERIESRVMSLCFQYFKLGTTGLCNQCEVTFHLSVDT